MSKQWIVICFVVLLSFSVGPRCFAQLYPKPKEGYEIKDNKIYFRHKNAGLIIESATPESIAAFYSDRGAAMGNPFEGFGSETQPLTIFLVTLLNRTNGDATFTPSYVTIKIKTEAFFPMDFTVFLEFTEGLQPATQRILERSIFLQPETIRPGQTMTKFLIYPALPKKFKELKLEFDYMFFESKELRPNFFFVRKDSVP